jgi:hypothetical protein
MAKFPIDYGDPAGEVDAINYLLSGPSGLGQFLQGFTSAVNTAGALPFNETAYLTGNYRVPYTNSSTATETYVAPIALATAQYLDDRTVKFTFAAAQATPPFALGNGPEVVGTSDPATYDGVYSGAGVVESTTTYVIVRVNGDGTTPAPATGGTIAFDAFGGTAYVSTDCGAKVTVNGGTDKVFVSAQINNILHYTCTTTSSFAYTVMINRRIAIPNNDPTNPDYTFAYDTTISTNTYYYQADAGSGTIPPAFGDIFPGYYQIGIQPIETIFTNIFDTPPKAYYWYVLELAIEVLSGDIVITQSELGNRSLSAQVVKL